MVQEKQNQRIPGYITATEQELIASAAALERREARSWVRLVLLDAARERIALEKQPMEMPEPPMPPVPMPGPRPLGMPVPVPMPMPVPVPMPMPTRTAEGA